MEEKTVNVSTESTEMLKAYAYDILAGIEAGQNQLKMINQEIVRRQKAVPAPTSEEPKPKENGETNTEAPVQGAA